MQRKRKGLRVPKPIADPIKNFFKDIGWGMNIQGPKARRSSRWPWDKNEKG